MRKIPEKDWKIIRSLKDEILDSACAQILAKARSIAEAEKGASHKAYLELWQLIHDEDKNIAIMFDDLSRSSAIFKVASWRQSGLLTDQQVTQFTSETQEIIESLTRP